MHTNCTIRQRRALRAVYSLVKSAVDTELYPHVVKGRFALQPLAYRISISFPGCRFVMTNMGRTFQLIKVLNPLSGLLERLTVPYRFLRVG